MVQQMSVAELKGLRDASQELVLLDVREPWELAIAHLSHTLDIPMNELPDRLQEIPRDRPVVVMCRSGARSLQVAHFLEQQQFSPVANLAGGILAWGEAFDPGLHRY